MIDDAARPLPTESTRRVLLAHGEGARSSRNLVREVVLKHFDNEFLHPLSDGAILQAIHGRPVMTTDGYVVNPLAFPGGDIGCLAVHGTINDLAVAGAEPIALSLALVVEEGLAWDVLDRMLASAASAASRCGVPIVTGDTKVVPRGVADGLFITTTGLGRLRDGIDLGPHRVRPGDRILLSGTIGDHGIAVLSAREGFGFEGELRSDTAPLHELMADVFNAGIDVHFARDPTRGGVSAVLHELVEGADFAAVLDEREIPIAEPVRGACEILGLDPLYVANEGKVLLIVSASDADRAVACLQKQSLGRSARIVGEIQGPSRNGVFIRGLFGVLRVLDEPSGALLPRIC